MTDWAGAQTHKQCEAKNKEKKYINECLCWPFGACVCIRKYGSLDPISSCLRAFWLIFLLINFNICTHRSRVFACMCVRTEFGTWVDVIGKCGAEKGPLVLFFNAFSIFFQSLEKNSNLITTNQTSIRFRICRIGQFTPFGHQTHYAHTSSSERARSHTHDQDLKLNWWKCTKSMKILTPLERVSIRLWIRALKLTSSNTEMPTSCILSVETKTMIKNDFVFIAFYAMRVVRRSGNFHSCFLF